jgi:AAHS family 4-hydroxybenzoate transporter-like MFS transporter
MIAQDQPFDIGGFIDNRKVGAYQYLVVLLCGLVMFIDGFNTQAASYIAPGVAHEWHLTKAQLGPMFSSALAGLMVGYLFLSPLSDRFGHKRIVVLSTFAFGVFTLVGVAAQNLDQLMLLRFLTGLGLGAAAPSAVALTGEYSPERLRASFVLAIYCGFSFGFIVAGMVAGALLHPFGWRSLFWVGALTPLALTPALMAFLPESIPFLLRTPKGRERAVGYLRRIDPALPPHAVPAFQAPDTPRSRTSVGALFGGKRAAGTLLLWFVFVVNLAAFYALQSWLPSILTGLHYPLSVVVANTTLTTVGGIAAAFLIGPAMDRLDPYLSLALLYGIGFVFVALTGAVLHSSLGMLMTANFFSGLCISGGQKSVIALAAIFYPPAVRSTGVGWALGVGRAGGIAGPLVMGAALAAKWPPSQVFYAMSVPVLVIGLAVFVMGRIYGKRRAHAA